MKERKIKVLKIEPCKAPEVVTLVNKLEELQKAVSIGADYVGLIEIIAIDDDICILCNEEGKLIYHNITPKLFGETPPTNRPPYIYNVYK